MMERLHDANIECVIANTVRMLCRNSISYSSKLHIQGTLGITVDASRVILIQLNESFEYDAEGSHRNTPARDGRDAAVTVQENSYSLADAKRPRMSSVVQCTRRPVGRGRGRVPVPPVRRVRSGHVVTGTTGSAQRARQQLAFPSSSKVVQRPQTAVQHVTPALCRSPHFPAGHVAASNDTRQQLPPKLEVEDERQAAFHMTQHPVSSDIICVDSDDEAENALEMKPRVSTSSMNSASVKSERQSQDALQMILDRAVMTARAGNPNVNESSLSNTIAATSSLRSVPSSDVQVDSMSMHYVAGNSGHTDIKPTIESSDMAVQQWTPSKRLLLSPSKVLPSTPTGIKTEVGAHSPVFSSSKPLHPGSASKLHSSPGTALPVATSHKDGPQQNPTSWTSVTETTFICTTAGCSKQFTTKRALVRHQKDKHGLVTRQRLAGSGQIESDSDTASGVL